MGGQTTHDDVHEGPLCYHLVHYQIRNIQNPEVEFPRRGVWEGAKFDPSMVSRNDIICRVFSRACLKSGEAAVEGDIKLGHDGHFCNFLNLWGRNFNNRVAGN